LTEAKMQFLFLLIKNLDSWKRYLNSIRGRLISVGIIFRKRNFIFCILNISHFTHGTVVGKAI
jgi:hypothetical protein